MAGVIIKILALASVLVGADHPGIGPLLDEVRAVVAEQCADGAIAEAVQREFGVGGEELHPSLRGSCFSPSNH